MAGSTCVGCGRAGRLLCPGCRADLPRTPYVTVPTPCPPGLLTTWAAAPYDGPVRDLVLGHKERGLVGLGPALGALLAGAVLGALTARDTTRDATRGPTGPRLLLVPVPSRPSATRSRGRDPTRAVVAHAASALRSAGWPVSLARPLSLRGPVRDQAGLTAQERAANLHGTLWCPSAAVRRLRARHPQAVVVVCDDVLTTGATLREAQRALTAAGLAPAAAGVVAATRRRSLGATLVTPATRD